MEAKLIKIKDGYELFTQGFLKGSTNHELIDSLNVEEGNIRYKLSLKNCQTIERGYDLDELAYEHYDIHIKRGHTEEDSLQRKIDFILGFQKALELMGDKKFSEEDMKYCWNQALKFEPVHITFGVCIESLQQTEWDVEIKMDDVWDGLDSTRIFPKEETSFPKLDADGCLILKKYFKSE